MSRDEPLRVVAVLDGTGGAAERQARALGGFLDRGLRLAPEEAGPAPAGEAPDVTLVFYADEADRDGLVALAPTHDVRLLRTPAHRPDLITTALTEFAAGGGAELFVFAGGPLGTELATRLAVRAGGAVATDVLDAAAAPGGLLCRRHAYSNHLVCHLELGPRPWCVTAAASWYESRSAAPAVHRVRGDAEMPADDSCTPAALHDVELLESPPTGDLEAARFLVVAGRGAGSRAGVERIAAAAARLGAAFGVTRPVVMNAWAAPDRQLGVSGTRAAPAVCVVAGASGAPAFLWGVERAAFIAAIDADESAAIVHEADAVVIDDAVAVIEALADIVTREGV